MKSVIQGYYQWFIVKNGKIISYQKDRKPNLILNSGLNLIGNNAIASCFNWARIGIGSNAVSEEQTILFSEIASSNNYFTQVGSCGSEQFSNGVILKRTFVFDAIIGDTQINEIGFSNNQVGPLFSRINTNFIIPSNTSLYLTYELVISFEPITPIRINNPIEGVSSSGLFQFQLAGIMSVQSDGSVGYFDSANGCNEPSENAYGFLNTDNAYVASFGYSVDRSLGITFKKELNTLPYVNDSFERKKVLQISQSEAIGNWACFGVGESINPEINTGLIYVCESDFTKNSNWFNVFFIYSWSRKKDSNILFYFLEEEEMFFKKQNPILTYFGLGQD